MCPSHRSLAPLAAPCDTAGERKPVEVHVHRRRNHGAVLLGVLALSTACGSPSGDSAEVPACEPGTDAPFDLAPWLRIRASATRPADGHDWPREMDAGPATVRDDVADNGWQPPDDEPAVLQLDLQPWLGRTISLDSLEASWRGTSPELSVAVLPGCGLEPSSELAWVDPAQPLDLSGHCGGCVELRLQGGEDTELAALSLLTRHSGIDDPALDAISGATSLGSHTGSGLIEGFYGQPWSWRERRAALVTSKRAGTDLYLYAPKDDPYHRDQWREPYPDEDLAAFEELASYANDMGQQLVVGISPFIDLDPQDDDDYAVLRDKVLALSELGIWGFALLADDIEFETNVTVDGELGATHAAFANRLLADLREVQPDPQLWFVPTVYSDERLASWEGAGAYLEALQVLDPATRVMWTGPGTFTEALEAEDMDELRALIGRDPNIWDNYWANDAWDLLQGRVHLDSYDGRQADLRGVVQGIGANPMIQGSLSRLNAGALAAWLEDPSPDTDYAGRATAASFESLLGYGHSYAVGSDALLLARVMQAFEGHGLTMPVHKGLEDAVAGLGEDPAAGALDLLPILAELATAGSELHHSGLDSELVDELVFPADKLHHEGMAGLWALHALGQRFAGGEGADALAAAEDELEQSAASRFVFSLGTVEDLVQAVVAVPVQDSGLVAPVVLPGGPPRCTEGLEMAWQVFGGAQQVEVYGLRGASAEGGVVTWTPPHAGTWRAVLTASTAGGGWAWVEAELFCWPQ